jgi:hypothetical protein
MLISASGVRGVSRLAAAGIAAVLLGLPSAAGATLLRPFGISPGDSFGRGSSGFGSDNVTLVAFRADFAEHALRRLDLGAPDLPPFPDGFSRERHRVRGGSNFDHLPRPPQLLAAFGSWPREINAERLRSFCPIKPPPKVPEPGTAVLLAGGLIALSLARRGRRT